MEGRLLEPGEGRILDKSMNESFDSSPAQSHYDNAKILVLWPQARGELQGFANHLERKGVGITADQIRLAVMLADEQFERMKSPLPIGKV